ncbi:zinc-binding dehydrogenase [Streptomyces sp. NPDC051940]|uniref:zinc-binding dehydrogenase n=1 Tax=Streptomyces sp. NPDC051940 TaxID=3155675 RepID=UPI0034158774
MRVIQAHTFGGPEVLKPVDVPEPEPGPGEAVVAVAAADTLFVETQIRTGWGKEYFDPPLPFTPGGAVSGTVLRVGEGVDRSRLGRRVVAHTGSFGGYAEQVTVAATGLIPVPDGVDLDTAAALTHDGPTALGLFEGAGVRPGETVLVLAAAGGAGQLLVQLAHAAGAYVVGAARGEGKLAAVRAHGADRVVDYSRPGWTDGIAADVVFDGVGGELGRQALDATADGARFRAYGAPSGDFSVTAPTEDAARRGVTVTGIFDILPAGSSVDDYTARALAEAAAGRLRPMIAERMPLEQAAGAHATIEARTAVGKILLVPAA